VTLNATLDNSIITFATAASTFNALTANADDGIAVDVTLTTDVGGLALEGDAEMRRIRRQPGTRSRSPPG